MLSLDLLLIVAILLGHLAVLLHLEPVLDPTIHSSVQTPDFRALLLALISCFTFCNAISQTDQRLSGENGAEASCTIDDYIARVRLLDEF